MRFSHTLSSKMDGGVGLFYPSIHGANSQLVCEDKLCLCPQTTFNMSKHCGTDSLKPVFLYNKRSIAMFMFYQETEECVALENSESSHFCNTPTLTEM